MVVFSHGRTPATSSFDLFNLMMFDDSVPPVSRSTCISSRSQQTKVRSKKKQDMFLQFRAELSAKLDGP